MKYNATLRRTSNPKKEIKVSLKARSEKEAKKLLRQFFPGLKVANPGPVRFDYSPTIVYKTPAAARRGASIGHGIPLSHVGKPERKRGPLGGYWKVPWTPKRRTKGRSR